ncbi:MAG: hypothetical protein WAR83_01355 [Flavobacteriales bacterium]
MKGKRTSEEKDQNKPKKENLYDLTTPLWHKYYKEMRKSIRFPRYYKKALNW